MVITGAWCACVCDFLSKKGTIMKSVLFAICEWVLFLAALVFLCERVHGQDMQPIPGYVAATAPNYPVAPNYGQPQRQIPGAWESGGYREEFREVRTHDVYPLQANVYQPNAYPQQPLYQQQIPCQQPLPYQSPLYPNQYQYPCQPQQYCCPRQQGYWVYPQAQTHWSWGW